MAYPGDRRQKDWLFFFLGMAAPFVLGNLGSSVMGFLGTAFRAEVFFGVFAAAGLGMLVIAPVTLLLIGRHIGSVRLESFGSGWLWGILVPGLLLLCAAGSCALLMSGGYN